MENSHWVAGIVDVSDGAGYPSGLSGKNVAVSGMDGVNPAGHKSFQCRTEAVPEGRYCGHDYRSIREVAWINALVRVSGKEKRRLYALGRTASVVLPKVI
ncbi:MAG: hypothetical protein ACPGNT_08075 [Rhodospirillales bacterium]